MVPSLDFDDTLCREVRGKRRRNGTNGRGGANIDVTGAIVDNLDAGALREGN